MPDKLIAEANAEHAAEAVMKALAEADFDAAVDVSKVPISIKEAMEPANNEVRAMRDRALAALESEGQRRRAPKPSEIVRVSPHIIDVEPGFNFRDFSQVSRRQRVATIGASIAQHGVKEALRGYYIPETGRYRLINGETRLRGVFYAMNVLGCLGPQTEAVDFRVLERGMPDDEQAAAQVPLNDSAHFNDAEMAIGVRQMLQVYKWTPERIATYWGMSPEKVEALIRLAELPQALRERIANGLIRKTEAINLAKATGGNGAAAAAIVDRAVEISKTDNKGGKKEGRATPKTLDKAMEEVGVTPRRPGRPRKTETNEAPPKTAEVVKRVSRLGVAEGAFARAELIENSDRTGPVTFSFSRADFQALIDAGFLTASGQ